MSIALLLLLCLICFAVLADRLLKNRPYETPFLMEATFVAICLPQLIGLYRNPATVVPPAALEKTLLMAVLSITMLEFGWRRGMTHTVRGPLRHYKVSRLTQSTYFLGTIGVVGAWEIAQLPKEVTAGGPWSGLSVAYLFFALALSYGYALGLFEWLKYRTLVVMPVIIVAALSYLDLIILGGRREPTAEFLLVPAILFWFVRRTAPPRILFILAIVAMAAFQSSVRDYRSVAGVSVAQRDWSQVNNIPVAGNLLSTLQNGGAELEKAAMDIEAKSNLGSYDFGAFHWNAIVQNYVPRQLVGENVKASLMFDLPPEPAAQFGYIGVSGATQTGLYDPFASFWYFGCFEFLVIGWISARLYKRAMQGDTVAGILYVILAPKLMQVITHDTGQFTCPAIHVAIFILPALAWARTAKVGKSNLVNQVRRAVAPSRPALRADSHAG